MNNSVRDYMLSQSRRHFFKRGAYGLGTAALASLMPRVGGAATTPVVRNAVGGLPELPHFAPKAKRAIYLFMAGAPCQMDLLDYSPEMAANPDKFYNKDLYDFVDKKYRPTTMTSGQKRFPVAPTKYKFEKCGRAGTWISELLPHTKTIVDDIAVIKSVQTEAINHDPAITYICTGNQIPGRASLGSWLSYGLGSENANLPAFVVMTPRWSGRQQAQALYQRLWGSGFLPSKHAGVSLRRSGDPVLFLSNPAGVDPATRRRMLDTLGKVNEETFNSYADPETQARIAAYEMAFKMQTSVPELTDISAEPKHVLDMYGPNVGKAESFARSALLGRRMLERGVRFVQIFHRGWDQHGNVGGDLPKQARDIDQPAAALIKDLKQRGMLDDTLVIWGGEFGRTIYSQGALSKTNYGRDHHPGCFSIWMAGGGIKSGVTYGETDVLSYDVVENPVHINDLNATILHQLGINHERFKFPVQGLNLGLTGVEEQSPIWPLVG